MIDCDPRDVGGNEVREHPPMTVIRVSARTQECGTPRRAVHKLSQWTPLAKNISRKKSLVVLVEVDGPGARIATTCALLPKKLIPEHHAPSLLRGEFLHYKVTNPVKPTDVAQIALIRESCSLVLPTFPDVDQAGDVPSTKELEERFRIHGRADRGHTIERPRGRGFGL